MQGVGFRAFVEHEAQKRGIEGWVRNRRDGTVEALFGGMPEQVEAMIEACRKGPPSSHVHMVEDRPGTDNELALRGDRLFAFLPTI